MHLLLSDLTSGTGDLRSAEIQITDYATAHMIYLGFNTQRTLLSDAALRSAYFMVTGHNPDPDAFTAVRGMDGWKEAAFDIPGAGRVRVAVVSGLGNTRKLMNALRSGKSSYDFVEVMACPGGCAGGGGQPIHDGVELAEDRGSVLWRLDQDELLRFSHENPDVKALYRDYLGSPLGEKSHHLLHTDHFAWEMPPKAL